MSATGRVEVIQKEEEKETPGKEAVKLAYLFIK